MKTKQIIGAYLTETRALSKKMTPLAKQRAKEIIKGLSGILPVETLLMGMGGWTFKGGEVEVYDIDHPQDTTWKIDINDAFSSLVDSDYCHAVKGATPRHKALAKEFYDLMEFLNEPQVHVENFDLNFKK